MIQQVLKTKFSEELDPGELLGLMMVLYEIARKRDFIELSRFVRFSAELIGPSDFNQMLRSLVRMMGNTKCGHELCSDWLMTQLYELYTALGTSAE